MVIVTGCNTGIGKETVLDLAARGAHIHMACRDKTKCEEAKNEIIEKTGNTNIFNRELDLASMESIRNFAKKYKLNCMNCCFAVNTFFMILGSSKKRND